MYAELHCHTNYSFQEGASSIDETVARASELGYRALAITDHDNLCGAMRFARVARSLDLQPIIGAELTLADGSHVTLLAETRKGYGNLCRLISYSYMTSDRREPKLDTRFIPEHAEGIILLTGCRNGRVPALLTEGREAEAEATAGEYLEWLGPQNVFMELQQNLVHGDTLRNRRLMSLGEKLGVGVVATNNVHYHAPDRHRLHDALVAIRHNKSLEETHRERRPNGHFYLKSPDEMAALFSDVPEAIDNTLRIAERCSFDLTRDLGYKFPDYPVPDGHTPQTYLEELCYEAATRRYGVTLDREGAGSGPFPPRGGRLEPALSASKGWGSDRERSAPGTQHPAPSLAATLKARLDEEFRLIRKHDLAGFFLIYHQIIHLARDIMIELGHTDPEVPLEERPPGRGRGSSVAMVVGYLIGLSHIDPLEFDLSLDRFLHDEMTSVPDIDLDFPRDIREELIKRVHEKWGWERAALSGMISTYKIKGAIRDLGKALGLPAEDIDKLAKRVDSHSAKGLGHEMLALPEFKDRVDAPVWRDLIDLAAQLDGFPKYLAQHPGGMIIGSSPLTDIVPVQQSAIDDRYICHWDKDSIDDAGFVKIDFLALGALSQMQDALQLIEQRTGSYIDLSRINFEDKDVYAMLHRAETIGIFQVESAAQMQTIVRIKPRNLTDMAYEVGAVRPGVGVNDGVTQFIKRRVHKVPWDYDHPLEKRALERTLGIILFQDQVNQVAIDVAGFSHSEADQLRRAFTRKNNEALVRQYWDKFREGSVGRGVPEPVAQKIFKKFNGHYMFPESHAFAFGVTAYHMSWLKHYYPLEFFVGIFNQQPMGFYNLETLKEDARRYGVTVLNPDINASSVKAIVAPEKSLLTPLFQRGAFGSPPLQRGVRGDFIRESGTAPQPLNPQTLLLGILHVKSVGEAAATAVFQERERRGPYTSLADAMLRTGLRQEAIEKLVMAGAFDGLAPDRRAALWEAGLRYRPGGQQQPLPLPVDQDMADLPALGDWESMAGEYASLGLYPKGHLMAKLRPSLGKHVLTSAQVSELADGTRVTVAGLVIRRQRPLSKAVFITLEDEFGHIPMMAWPKTYARYRLVLREPLVLAGGFVSRRDGTMNIILTHAKTLPGGPPVVPQAHSWR